MNIITKYKGRLKVTTIVMHEYLQNLEDVRKITCYFVLKRNTHVQLYKENFRKSVKIC